MARKIFEAGRHSDTLFGNRTKAPRIGIKRANTMPVALQMPGDRRSHFANPDHTNSHSRNLPGKNRAKL